MRFKVVTGNTARNPVARSIARQRVHARFTAAKLRIFMLDAGVDDSAYLYGVLKTLSVIARACELQWPKKDGEHTMPPEVLLDWRVLRGGCSALEGALTCWDPAQAVAIEQAIDRAERLNKLLKTGPVHAAGVEMGMLVEHAK